MQIPTNQLLQKYFRGECTPEEKNVVELYLSLGIDADRIDHYLIGMGEELKAQEYMSSEAKDEAIRSKVQKIVNHNKPVNVKEVPFVSPDPVNKSNHINYLTYGLAASVIIAVFFIALHIFRNATLSDRYVYLSSDTVVRKKVMLPDSTVIWMNAMTELRYKEGFGNMHRNIELVDGEAYFDVHRNPNLPFVVKAQSTSTEVLGTAFLITSYAQLAYTDIQVTRGKVNVKTDRDQYLGMTKGDAVHYDAAKNQGNTYTFDKARFDPVSQNMFLQGVTFHELALRVEALYGYKLVAANSEISSKRYTIEITASDDVESLISNISWIHHGTYKIIGKEVFMH